jgi:hypothetical protein
MLRRALVGGKMLAEPSLNEVPLLSRYYPVPLQAAVVFAVFSDHVRAIIGNAYQSSWIATFTVVGGVDNMAICWHNSNISQIGCHDWSSSYLADREGLSLATLPSFSR